MECVTTCLVEAFGTLETECVHTCLVEASGTLESPSPSPGSSTSTATHSKCVVVTPLAFIAQDLFNGVLSSKFRPDSTRVLQRG